MLGCSLAVIIRPGATFSHLPRNVTCGFGSEWEGIVPGVSAMRVRPSRSLQLISLGENGRGWLGAAEMLCFLFPPEWGKRKRNDTATLHTAVCCFLCSVRREQVR